MTYKKIHIPILLAVVLCCSCEKVLEIDIPDSERHVTVNGLPCADSTLFVNVTYSRFFLDNQPFIAIDNATVSIDINGIRRDATTHDGANYLFSQTATAGDTLTLRVCVPGRDTVVGGTRVPSLPDMPIPLAEIDTLQPISLGDVSFTLTDPIDERNYYQIYFLERDSGSRWNRWEERWDTIDTVIHPYFSCLDLEITAPEVNVAQGLMNYFNNLLFTDSLINGTDYDITVSIPMLKDTAEHPIQRTYTLVVQALSPEAFRYKKEVAEAQSVSQYFAEPALIYSNLRGGLGIFAAIAKRVFPLTFTYKEPEPEEKRGR